ncbi:unnamed protein product, partial [Symbiodinium pilosum]
VLKPYDAIRPYRLEMTSKLKGKTMYDLWGDAITEALAKDLKASKAKFLVNCASQDCATNFMVDVSIHKVASLLAMTAQLAFLLVTALLAAAAAVIAAGVSRTSTQSLSLALARLGYKTLHAEGFHPKLQLAREAPDIVDRITKAARRSFAEQSFEVLVPTLEQLEMFNVTALVDIPWSEYGVELHSRYPNAKVIVTVREKESWFRSYWEHFRWGALLPPPPFPSFPITQPFPLTILYQPFAQYWRLVSQRLGCGAVTRFPPWPLSGDEKQACLDGFEDHVQRLRQAVPPESLLIYNIWEGWEPICRFLGKPIPEEVGPWTFVAFAYLCYALPVLACGLILRGCARRLRPTKPLKQVARSTLKAGVQAVTCDFAGPSSLVKQARGAMCKYIVQKRVKDPNGLKKFTGDEKNRFAFNAAKSSNSKLVFTRGGAKKRKAVEAPGQKRRRI